MLVLLRLSNLAIDLKELKLMLKAAEVCQNFQESRLAKDMVTFLVPQLLLNFVTGALDLH